MSFFAATLANLFKKPLTEAFPFGPPTTPPRYRGRVTFDPARCAGCAVCAHVCAPGAIRLDPAADGLEMTIWHGSCVFCGLCAHYCPTGAIAQSADWHLAHAEADKYALAEHGHVPYGACRNCGEPILAVPPPMIAQAFRRPTPEVERLRHLCPKCRAAVSLKGMRHVATPA